MSVGPLPQSGDLAHESVNVFEKRAEEAIRAMRRSLREPPSITELAEEARITPWHFIRLFSRTVASPPGKYLASLRIEFAKKLLLKTPEKVTEICFDLGFSRGARAVSISGLCCSGLYCTLQ